MRTSERGFTLVEVLIAVVVLGIGVTALVGSSALVTRMVGRGISETKAAEAATKRLESMRLLAYSTTPRCTAGTFANGGPQYSGAGNSIRERWIITVSAATKTGTITDTVTHRTATGTHTDVITTRVEC
jgi:prepilin-type N-terminal cleavage/methylation domain-containing protein